MVRLGLQVGRKLPLVHTIMSVAADVYVMNADGSNLVNLTQNQSADDFAGSWHPTPLVVSTEEKLVTLWSRIKQNEVK